MNKIQNQISAFDDYNLNEIFEEINILNNNNFILLKQSNNLYKLKIKFIILRRKKYLYINLYNNNNFDRNDLLRYISELKEIIKSQNEKIKMLENILNQHNYSFNNKKESIHLLNYHTNEINCLTVLKDGRLASGSEDKSIIIYNNKTFQPDLEIKEHSESVTCLTTLNSGVLASSSEDNTIKLINIKDNKYEIIQTLTFKNSNPNKIIELNNKSLVSNFNNSIIFYIQDNNNKYKQNFSIPIQGNCYTMIETKDNEICYSGLDNIYFYDSIQRKKNKMITNIDFNIYNLQGFVMISKELLFIPGVNKISIININEYNKNYNFT